MRRLLFAAILLSCSRSAPPAPVRYGPIMAETGRRFELAGRAAAAGRFELAAFEAGELQELFEDDLPRAELPKEGPTATLPALASDFSKTHPPALKKAAAAKDRAAFADAFQRAATACNACHQASGRGFLEIPSALEKSVPNLEPISADGALR